MKASISIGEYTTNPYCVAGLDIPVYCIEELCYLIRENALLIDSDFMTRELVKWIETECVLPELAEALSFLVNRQGSLVSFVCTILNYVGLYDLNVYGDIKRALKEGVGLTNIERHKNQVDYLAKKKKYTAAIRGYRALIAKWDSYNEELSFKPAVTVLSSIWHNLGVAYTGIMSYESAAECFHKAYELDGARVHLTSYLAAYRMLLSDEEYIAFASEHPEARDVELDLEHSLEQLRKKWPQDPLAMRLIHRRKLRDENDFSTYNSENEVMLQALKEGFRDIVSD